MTTPETSPKASTDFPKPPGDIRPTLEAVIPQESNAEPTAAELQLEVDRLNAIIHYGIPAEYHYMVQGPDAETINHKANSLAELITRANGK
jgi:hypothetical protein